MSSEDHQGKSQKAGRIDDVPVFWLPRLLLVILVGTIAVIVMNGGPL